MAKDPERLFFDRNINKEVYQPPKGHDKHLSDTERAHSGAPGSKVRHGADATGRLQNRTLAAYGVTPRTFETDSKRAKDARWMEDYDK